MAANKTSMLGAAGEHYVMAELLRRGYIAALAPQGVPNADIVVTDIDGNKLCSIQVKTRGGRGADGGWHMRPKHENIRAPHLFYCFVDFGAGEEARPSVYVVPSACVADAVASSHQQWLRTLGKYGQKHNDNPVRRFLPDYSTFFPTANPYPKGWLDQYRDGWKRLGLEQPQAEQESDIAVGTVPSRR